MSSAGILLRGCSMRIPDMETDLHRSRKGELIMAVKIALAEIQTAVKQHYLML